MTFKVNNINSFYILKESVQLSLNNCHDKSSKLLLKNSVSVLGVGCHQRVEQFSKKDKVTRGHAQEGVDCCGEKAGWRWERVWGA